MPKVLYIEEDLLIEGSLFAGTKQIATVTVRNSEQDLRFSQRLSNSLREICQELDISLPLWMDKNTREFAVWQQTIFYADQFIEEVKFTRFQLKCLDEE